ncbi:SLBB domain-containing protein [Pseudomonadota bacterium]
MDETNHINFPLIGEVKIGNTSQDEAEKRIEQALRDGGYVREPQVTIIVEQQHSRQISVLGYVKKPAKYSVDQPTTLVDIIAMAGGISREGSDIVRLIRNSGKGQQEQIEIDLRKMLISGDMSQNLKIESNSTIYVAPMDKFYIYGQVNRPGAYKLEPGMTVMQAIAVGGGINIKGSTRDLRISRHHINGSIEDIEADVKIRLQANDVVFVKERLF